MEVIYLLIAFSLLVALIFLGLFFWAVKTGQFDDQY
ncbi:MAG: cbb3-type cytochrome oxidase assembly protein CcoS, partial [Balneolaceae bacterium]